MSVCAKSSKKRVKKESLFLILSNDFLASVDPVTLQLEDVQICSPRFCSNSQI
jgi:hypothetical protein